MAIFGDLAPLSWVPPLGAAGVTVPMLHHVSGILFCTAFRLLGFIDGTTVDPTKDREIARLAGCNSLLVRSRLEMWHVFD